MASAQCSGCGRMTWMVPDHQWQPRVEIVPLGAVGSRIWCNDECVETWRQEHPDEILILED